MRGWWDMIMIRRGWWGWKKEVVDLDKCRLYFTDEAGMSLSLSDADNALHYGKQSGTRPMHESTKESLAIASTSLNPWSRKLKTVVRVAI